ncbi:MAG TPA: type III secretion inner membrane ring lipoprotein SctJ [Albitalea sp.]|uniref:type III secretion system inner membrane ring lipoprotein SctJ n=1 Tax=Piscinibacter sp. TaxID=1903157 RepID=UPI002ED0E793
MKTSMSVSRVLPVLLLALAAGCSNQELYGQLSERQANEMVALLRSAGIDADKQAQEGGRFAVRTSRGDFPQAVRTLSAQGYPREQFDSMGKVFKREGFVSSPLEERARLVHALSQEISNTIATIDGVVTARVHLVVPERNPLADKPQPAAAAVFIKHRPDKDLSAQTAQIKALVVNSIEGLPYDNVTVALFPAENWPPEGARPAVAPAAARSASLNGPLLSAAIAGIVAIAVGGLMWWRRRQAVPRGVPGLPHAGLTHELQSALRRAAGPR